MRVVIVGAGKLGYSIAELLSQEEYDIVVIDKEEKQLSNIKENLDVLTIAANGSSPITMDDPDVQGADMLIAVTGSDFGCGNCFFWIIGMNRKRNFLLF